MNCVQYQETGKQPHSLFWLPSASLLVAISKTNLSFYRALDVLEESLITDHSNESNNNTSSHYLIIPCFIVSIFLFKNFSFCLGQSYMYLLRMINSVELSDEQKLKFSQALHGFYPLTDVLGEVAAEFKLENKLNLVSIRQYFSSFSPQFDLMIILSYFSGN